MTPETKNPSDAAISRFCVWLFCLSLLLNVCFSARGITNTLLGPQEFRQAHTALSVFWFLKDGVSLNYETPILGPPWAIPYEFPVYQACTVWLIHATGWSIEVSGRVVSWLFFASALPACYLLLARFRIPPARRLVFLALLLTSPLYLFYSRAFYIESCVLALSAWFLVGFDRFLANGRLPWFAVAIACGIVAGMTKLTTFGVFLIAAFLFLVGHLRRRPGPPATTLWLRAGATVALPLLATGWWTFHASAIRHLNPDMAGLNDHLLGWVFGGLNLRFSPDFWLRVYRLASGPVAGEAGIGFIVLYFCWLCGRHRWAAFATLAVFFGAQLVFTNLYWMHDYYFYENGAFLVAAVGFFVTELLAVESISVRRRCTFAAIVVLLQVGTYFRTYFREQGTNVAIPDVCRLLQAVTRPDDTVVVLGHDWIGSVPYYAQRRALMLMAGRERDPDGIRQSIERLDPKKVGAVYIYGAQWQDRNLIEKSMSSLHLGHQPMYSNNADVGVWIPAARQPELRDAWEQRDFPMFQLSPEENTTGQPRTILAREIRRLAAFNEMHPRPIRATALNSFTWSTVDDHRVLNAHATTELAFRAKAGQHVTGLFGILPGAYDGAGFTDGVEFVASQRAPDGHETVLFHRLLNPHGVAADRGLQKLDLTLPKTFSGELLIRSLPGPANNWSYDWSYWGEIKIE